MIEGPDLSGKTCLVTGATSGHGRAVSAALSRMGADMVVLGRNREKCETVRMELFDLTGKRPDILVCDLSSMTDIRRAASEFLSRERPLHILVNNAGQVNQGFRETVDGFEETFAVNYLSMFLLTRLLIERIQRSAPARIVNVSSDTHYIADLDLDDVEGRSRRYSFMGAYGRSKLAIVYFTRELNKRLAGSGVTVNAVDPGPVRSNIANKPGAFAKIANSIIQLAFPKAERAALTAVYCSSSPDLDGQGGGYYRHMKKKEPKVSSDPEFGARLWEITERLVRI
jgi:retinol dehydrogenase-12